MIIVFLLTFEDSFFTAHSFMNSCLGWVGHYFSVLFMGIGLDEKSSVRLSCHLLVFSLIFCCKIFTNHFLITNTHIHFFALKPMYLLF